MLVQPQPTATVCELDLVRHAIRSSRRAQTLDPNQPPEKSHEPLNLTLDLEYAHVSGHCLHGATTADAIAEGYLDSHTRPGGSDKARQRD